MRPLSTTNLPATNLGSSSHATLECINVGLSSLSSNNLRENLRVSATDVSLREIPYIFSHNTNSRDAQQITTTTPTAAATETTIVTNPTNNLNNTQQIDTIIALPNTATTSNSSIRPSASAPSNWTTTSQAPLTAATGYCSKVYAPTSAPIATEQTLNGFDDEFRRSSSTISATTTNASNTPKLFSIDDNFTNYTISNNNLNTNRKLAVNCGGKCNVIYNTLYLHYLECSIHYHFLQYFDSKINYSR